MKYYFFRDLRNDDNHDGYMPYHAAGIVNEVCNERETKIGNDLSVSFIHPFTGIIKNDWRTYSDVELFEADRREWMDMNALYEIIEKYMK